jgi:hypothetical protein
LGATSALTARLAPAALKPAGVLSAFLRFVLAAAGVLSAFLPVTLAITRVLTALLSAIPEDCFTIWHLCSSSI